MSIFDDDEERFYRTRFAGPKRSMVETISLTPQATVAAPFYASSPKKRKRTPLEALARANTAGSRLWRPLRAIPPFRIYGFLLQGLTYGFILVDPLDRLEGGLID